MCRALALFCDKTRLNADLKLCGTLVFDNAFLMKTHKKSHTANTTLGVIKWQ